MSNKPTLRIRQDDLFAPTRVEIHAAGARIDISHLVQSVRWERNARDVPAAVLELSPAAAEDVELWAKLDGVTIDATVPVTRAEPT